MNKNSREILFFFFSQYFSDSLRITLGVLLPALIFAQFQELELGLALSVGAFGASITDSPGPFSHRRNGILLCLFFSFLVALLTEFASSHNLLLGFEILALSFFFSMFTVYGNRAASVGTAALLVMVLNMSPHFGPDQRGLSSLLILGGGLWYLILSMLFSRMMPYLPAQQALGECIHEVARFLKLKAEFYSPGTRLEEDYDQVVSQQIVVNEKQNAVREMLFKSRLIVKESTPISRNLLLIFVDVVDLYEQIMSIHYDYAALREKYRGSGILENITSLTRQMGHELDNIGLAIQSNTHYKIRLNLQEQLEQLKARIDALGQKQPEESNLPLKKILVNLRNLARRVQDIGHNYEARSATDRGTKKKLEYTRFVSHQDFSLKIFRDNLTFRSASFKHALRMMVACILGFVAARFFAQGTHSYWVILTIIFILKPGFSLTKQRNYQRLIGTLAGGLIGILIVMFIQDKTVLFFLILFFMIGAYSFLRTNYILAVTFITPLVLVLFMFLGAGSLSIVYERVLDTLIGCGIAFAINYLLFPSWESEQLNQHLGNMLKANAAYLQKVAQSLAGQQVEEEAYKLARKEVYVSSANLSAAFQRMTTEPKNRQQNSKEVHQFVVLNHILSSYIATIASTLLSGNNRSYPPEYIRLLKRTLGNLQESLEKLAPAQASTFWVKKLPEAATEQEKPILSEEDMLLKEQLEYIRKLSEDLYKVTEGILKSPPKPNSSQIKKAAH